MYLWAVCSAFTNTPAASSQFKLQSGQDKLEGNNKLLLKQLSLIQPSVRLLVSSSGVLLFSPRIAGAFLFLFAPFPPPPPAPPLLSRLLIQSVVFLPVSISPPFPSLL